MDPLQRQAHGRGGGVVSIADSPADVGVAAVTVVIVAYDSGGFLQPCVDALAAQSFTDFEAVIADNASTDGSVARLHLPDVRFRIRDMGANTGFAVANTVVAQESRSEFLVLLNPDAVADPAWLDHLIAAARAYPLAASFGSTQLRLDDPSVLDGVGDVWHAAGLAWRAGEGWPVDRAPGDGEIFGPCGAAALYRRRAFVDAGGFDARFFCYCEDVDLAARLRAGGATSRRVADAVVRHAGSGISGRRSDFTLFHGHRNRIWVFVKTTPGAWFWLLLPYHLAFNLLYLGSALRRGVFPPIWRSYVAAVRGLGPMWRARRELAQARRTPFAEQLKVMAWTPWAPFRRELHPRPGTFPMKMKRKADLPTKPCARCGRPFAWRRKWAAVWDEVRYCSDRCRGERTAGKPSSEGPVMRRAS